MEMRTNYDEIKMQGVMDTRLTIPAVTNLLHSGFSRRAQIAFTVVELYQ